MTGPLDSVKLCRMCRHRGGAFEVAGVVSQAGETARCWSRTTTQTGARAFDHAAQGEFQAVAVLLEYELHGRTR